YEKRGYDEISVPSAPLQREDRNNPTAWQIPLAGAHTAIRYEGPVDRSALEIARNYEASLKKNGFEIKFFCRQDECSPGRMLPTFWEAARGKVGRVPSAWDSMAYLLAERDAP